MGIYFGNLQHLIIPFAGLKCHSKTTAFENGFYFGNLQLLTISQKKFKFSKKGLTNTRGCDIITKSSGGSYSLRHLGVAQLVARYLGVVEAASSSLVTQTRKSLENIKFSRLFLFLFSYDFGDFLKISKKRFSAPLCSINFLDAFNLPAYKKMLWSMNCPKAFLFI